MEGKLSSIHVNEYDPLPAVNKWLKSGQASRRPYVAPHGKHRQLQRDKKRTHCKQPGKYKKVD